MYKLQYIISIVGHLVIHFQNSIVYMSFVCKAFVYLGSPFFDIKDVARYIPHSAYNYSKGQKESKGFFLLLFLPKCWWTQTTYYKCLSIFSKFLGHVTKQCFFFTCDYIQKWYFVTKIVLTYCEKNFWDSRLMAENLQNF